MGKGRRDQRLPMCEYGSACKRNDCIYRHPCPDPKESHTASSVFNGASGSGSTQAIDTNTICVQFLSGECAFGSRCRNRHATGEEAQRILENYSKVNCRWGQKCNNRNCLYFHGHQITYGEEMESIPAGEGNDQIQYLENFNIPLPKTVVEFYTSANKLLKEQTADYYDEIGLDFEVRSQIGTGDEDFPEIIGRNEKISVSLKETTTTHSNPLPDYGSIVKKGLAEYSQSDGGIQKHSKAQPRLNLLRSTSRLSQWMSESTNSTNTEGSAASNAISTKGTNHMVKLERINFQPLSRSTNVSKSK